MNRKTAGIGAGLFCAALLGGSMLSASAHDPVLAGNAHGAGALAMASSGISQVSALLGLEDQGTPGAIDDGKDLLPRAQISLEDAIAAAQANTSGTLGEVDLEYFDGHLVFNVDMGSSDVKIDAATGVVLGQETDDSTLG